ncbi:MAG: 50S ribosomal protein L13 [Nanoarchaeota archaeon]
MNTTKIIDGEHAVLGRLASYAAKQALLGNKVVVVNCDKVVISGRRLQIISDYKITRARGGHSQKGPIFPTTPAKIVKRTIRGMLSYKDGRGASAFKRIKCYEKIPKEFNEANKENISVSAHGNINLKELSMELR